MLEVSETQLKNKPNYLLYIHTPFCGTCHVARTFLEKIEATHRQTIFYEMNGSLNPDFMQRNKIESVPCLLIKRDDEIKENIYIPFCSKHLPIFIPLSTRTIFNQKMIFVDKKINNC